MPVPFQKRIWFFVALMAVCIGLFADNTASITGFVHDGFTKENLIGTRITLMKGDSIVGTGTANADLSWMGKNGLWYFDELDINSAGEYVLLFHKEGYKDKTVSLTELLGKKRLKKDDNRYVGDIAMDKAPKSHELNGVTVRATKVKFYNRGDTLVYDADAFQTAEGSMLDALIKQLPGVRLNDNGEIFVNGRKVESLMLNGEHFFKGHNQVLLQNLPAYMVKSVKSYEKAGNMSQIMGRDMGDKELVMDVILKKQYQIGWIGNMEGGLGSKDRYLARLFALRFTPLTRLAVYGNLNNLNDSRKPGENSSWTPQSMPSGLLATKKAGVDILLKSKDGVSKWEGNAELQHTDLDSHTRTTGETFLSGGDVFSRALNVSKNKDFTLTTHHHATAYNKKGSAFVELTPEFTYRKFRALTQSVSMAFNRNPGALSTSALIDSAYESTNPGFLATIINRNLNNFKQDGHRADLNLTGTAFAKLNGLRQIMLSPRFTYSAEVADRWRQQQIDYPNSPTTPGNTQNRYTRLSPDKKLDLGSEFRYIRYIGDVNVHFIYDIDYHRSHGDTRTYLLNDISGWDDFSAHPIGTLPSQREYELYQDRQNTEYSIFSGVTQTPALRLATSFAHQTKEDSAKGKASKLNYFSFILNLPVAFSHDRLDYTRAAYDGITRRNNAFFNPSFTQEIMLGGRDNVITINYKMTHTAPSMLYALNIANTADPLNIFYGNEHLRNTARHAADIQYAHTNPDKQLNYSLSAKYDISHNDIAMGYIYDKTTGIRTYAPDNVSGNYNLVFDFSYSRPLNKHKSIILDNSARYHLSHGVDLSSSDTGLAPHANSVFSHRLSDRINLNYRISGKVNIGAKGYVGYAHSHSDNHDFSTLNLWDFHYGLTSLISLPWSLQFSTDLTMYSRRGYATHSSNSNDLVWNARLTKTFAKQGLTLALDGFDILGNLSNVSYILNSQGRTETYRNSLPRYVMFHAIFHLNRQPHKTPAGNGG